jgi:hypothetical protein
MEEGADAAIADRERQAPLVSHAHDQALRGRAEMTMTEEVLAVRGHVLALAIGVTCDRFLRCTTARGDSVSLNEMRL